MTNHGSIDVDVTIDGVVNGTVQEGSGGGTRNYERLTNKPQINDVELVGNKSLVDLGIVNNEQPDWEQHDTEAGDYIKHKPSVPKYLKDLESDVMHRTVTDSEIVSWNQKSKVVANPGNTSGTLSSIGIDGTNYAIQGGGGGAVDSVNGKTGAVVLDATDVGALPDSTPLFSGDYDDLTHKPTIPDDLADLNDDSTHRLVTDTEKTTWNSKSDFSGSYTDLTDKPTFGTASAKDYVNSVVDGSSDLVTSDAVHDYVDSAISGVYKPSGNKTCAELLPALLIASNLGNVYNMIDSGVTTSDFVEGAGKTIEIGDNVVIVDIGTQNNASYKFDLLSGMVDLSNYIQKSATSGLMKNDGSVDTNSYATTSQIPDITGKADKVTSAVDGNFAGLDSNGNLTDSGHKHSDYLTQHQDISGKADKVTGAVNGNLAKLDANGNLADGGWSSLKTTTSAIGNPISISGLKSNQLAVNPIITFDPIQAGSGTPSPSNIRAISGYDKIEVLSCGHNVWDEVWEKGSIDSSGQPVSSDLCIRSKNFISIASNTTYGGSQFKANGIYEVFYYDINKNFISSYGGYFDVVHTITTPANAKYLKFRTTSAYGNTYNNDISINYPSSDDQYHAYHKTTDLSESIGITGGNGTCNVRSGLAKFETIVETIDGNTSIELWTAPQSPWTGFIYAPTGIKKPRGGRFLIKGSYIKSEDAVVTDWNGYGVDYRIFVCLNASTIGGTTLSDIKTWLTSNPLQICYELATAFTIQLTPHEISLLKDYAYVSTNGTSIALDYHNGELASLADVSQLGETVNEGFKTIADNIIVEGKQFSNVTFANNTDLYFNVTKTGYEPIGVVGFLFPGTDRTKVLGLHQIWIGNDPTSIHHQELIVTPYTTQSATGGFMAYILYKRV